MSSPSTGYSVYETELGYWCIENLGNRSRARKSDALDQGTTFPHLIFQIFSEFLSPHVLPPPLMSKTHQSPESI